MHTQGHFKHGTKVKQLQRWLTNETFAPLFMGNTRTRGYSNPEVFKMFILLYGARNSVVVEALCYKPEGQGFRTRWGEWIFSIYLILPAGLGSGVYSASNRNEYQKQKNNVERVRCVGLTTLPPSVSRLSIQCGIFNISQPYRPPRPVTGIVLLRIEHGCIQFQTLQFISRPSLLKDLNIFLDVHVSCSVEKNIYWQRIRWYVVQYLHEAQSNFHETTRFKVTKGNWAASRSPSLAML
jgi:hypothetical protein